MNLLTNMRRRMIANKFAQQGLGIIEQIPEELFFTILRRLNSEGWEVFPDHLNLDSLGAKGKCKLRKGQSTLEFEWDNDSVTSIVGIERIVSSIAKDYALQIRNKPSYLEKVS